MTLTEIRNSNIDFLYPKDVCEVLQCHPYSINVQAKEDPAKLGFPVTIIGTRVRIPRLAFLKWVEGAGMWDSAPGPCAIQGESNR